VPLGACADDAKAERIVDAEHGARWHFGSLPRRPLMLVSPSRWRDADVDSSGRTTGRRANLLGLLPVGLGAIALSRCYPAHRASAPGETVQISLTPDDYLVASGPYRFSRNSVYLAEQTMWLGWSLFFGSLRVAGASGVLAVGMNVAVRR
jgi:hypothetical protein